MARHRPHLLLTIAAGFEAVPVDEETRHHLSRVLRYQPGSPVTYTNGAGLFGDGIYDGDVIFRGVERTLQPPTDLTVATAPPSENARVRFLVEKLAELGVRRLVWLKTHHGEGRPPRPDKVAAWAKAALEQSRGAWLMETPGSPVSISAVAGMGVPVFADPGGDPMSELPRLTDPVLCVGPEGGFAADEIPKDATRLSLGDTVLRLETAAIVGAALFCNRS